MMIPINAAGGAVNPSRLGLIVSGGLLVFWLGLGVQQALAAAAGVFLAIVNTRMLAGAVRRAGKAALRDAAGSARPARGYPASIYAEMILRWVIVMAGLALAIGWLGLSALGLLAGYGVTTLAAAVIANSRY